MVGLLLCVTAPFAQLASVSSPDGQLRVDLLQQDSTVAYTVSLGGKIMLEPSPLGLYTNEGDFATRLRFEASQTGKAEKHYRQTNIKQAEVHYMANTLTCTLINGQQRTLKVVFQVSNHNIAFCYELPGWGERKALVVQQEATGYRFPEGTTTFLANMMSAMTGFARTTPSYENSYEADMPLQRSNRNGEGYVFPALFRVGQQGWVLLSETGVSSAYCAAHLSEYRQGLYTIAYPNPNQNNGFGSTGAAIVLPGTTPWRTITVGSTLQPVAETTIATDLVEPLYEPSVPYQYGKGTWSWIVWQDGSMNYADQVQYIDLAAAMGYDYILIDALWDTQIGKSRMQELIGYAASKKVKVFLWYNSNGTFNDAPQGPRNKMHTAIARKQEMKWLREAGVKGIKVDFLGGDKQETMRLYEDILSDANDFGLMVVFHGATLPRGWERMYPNFAGAEAVVASEMLIFSQGVREAEAFNATMHPFIRNAVAAMEFGGVLLNKFLVKSNTGRNKRLTTDAFQLATAVLFQNPVQFFGLTPNNLTDVPAFELEFLKKVPVTWHETRFIDGYPGKYAVLARRNGNNWYVAGVNGQKDILSLELKLPMLAGRQVKYYYDKADGTTTMGDTTVDANGRFKVSIPVGGGFVLTQ